MRIQHIVLFFFFLFVDIHAEYSERYGFIRSCSGCQLNKMPELKSFLKNNSTQYDIDVLYPGGEPCFAILNSMGEELERTPIGDLTAEQICQLIEEKGFSKLS